MKTTKFQIKERILNKLSQVTYTGKSNVDIFHFEFDEEWLGLEKTLVIITDISTYNIPLLNDEAVVPNEFYLDSQIVTVGVFGKKDDIILSSTLKNIWLTKGAYTLGQEPSNIPTPTQWDLYIQEINNLINKSQDAEAECKKTLEEVKNYKDNVEKVADTFEENVTEKIKEYNTNVENKKKELEDFSKSITVITAGTDDLIDGVSELPAGSMYLVYETDEDEVNQDA